MARLGWCAPALGSARRLGPSAGRFCPAKLLRTSKAHHSKVVCLCVYVFVCVRVRAREREIVGVDVPSVRVEEASRRLRVPSLGRAIVGRLLAMSGLARPALYAFL